jgi:hypothetical protein
VGGVGAANGAGGDGEGGSGTATVNNSDGESDSQVHFFYLKPPSFKTRFLRKSFFKQFLMMAFSEKRQIKILKAIVN